jgi:hypothetical protein
MALSVVPEVGSPPVQIGDPVEDLDTPLILADLDRMERNIYDWQSWMDQRGVALRVPGYCTNGPFAYAAPYAWETRRRRMKP